MLGKSCLNERGADPTLACGLQEAFALKLIGA